MSVIRWRCLAELLFRQEMLAAEAGSAGLQPGMAKISGIIARKVIVAGLEPGAPGGCRSAARPAMTGDTSAFCRFFRVFPCVSVAIKAHPPCRSPELGAGRPRGYSLPLDLTLLRERAGLGRSPKAQLARNRSGRRTVAADTPGCPSPAWRWSRGARVPGLTLESGGGQNPWPTEGGRHDKRAHTLRLPDRGAAVDRVGCPRGSAPGPSPRALAG